LSAFGAVLLYAVIIGLAVWALVLRPVRRQRARRDLIVSRLAVGVRVMLTSGLLARVVEIDGDEVVLDAGEGVRLRYVSRAVATVLDQAEPHEPDEPGSEGNSEDGPDVSDRET
jgi:preprotein translocase YajC subunit